MLLRHRLVVPAIFSALAMLAGCGTSKTTITPPPSGGFSVSNFNGTYVFSTSGSDVNFSPIMITGALTADGSGHITGGSFTFADGSVGVGTNQAITGGTYIVTKDGRGQANLQNSSALGTVMLDFALASSSNGVVTEYDTNGSGSGTLDLQSGVSQSDINGQSYAFSVAGAGSNGPIATVGAFTLDSTGLVSSGVQDLTSTNATGTTLVASSQNLNLSNTSSVTVGTGTAPGTAVISSVQPFTFDVYAVDPTHLKLIETDGLVIMSGDMFTQQTSLPTGTVVFSMAGLDQAILPLSIAGQLPISGGTINGAVEDYNDAGIANSASSVSGGLSALSNGRSLLSLNGIVNGSSNQLPGNYSFAAYPSSGGLLLLEVDNAGITSGTALVQSSTSFSASAGYAVNLSGSNTSSEEDDIAEFTSTSSGFSGIIDYNDQGSLNPNQKLSGSYSSLSTGRYSLTSSAFNGNFYTVDGTTVLFLETDSSQVGNGVFVTQSTPTSSHAAAAPSAHFMPVRPKAIGRQALKWRSK